MIWTGLMTWCAAPVMSRTSAEIRHEQKATIAVAFFMSGANQARHIAAYRRAGAGASVDTLRLIHPAEQDCAAGWSKPAVSSPSMCQNRVSQLLRTEPFSQTSAWQRP